MTELSGPLTEFLAQAIPQEAAPVSRAYKPVPREDLEQEMWAKVLGDRDNFERLVTQGAYGVARKWLRQAAWKLVREDERYRRAVKAAQAGYAGSDEQFYSTGVLRKLIPMWLDNGSAERPPQGREQPKVSGSGGSSDYQAMMLDVSYGMSRIKGHHGSILKRYYEFPQGSGGYTHLEIAGRLGIEPDALRMRVNRALGALQRQLGGRNPWNRRGLEYQDSREPAARKSA
jgi:hypothetical protein